MSRQLELILTANGGAELWDINAEIQLWASDSDDEFREEFPDFLDENDVEHALDYLVAHDHMTEDEADNAEISSEALEPETVNGDDDDDDDDDGDDLEGE